MTFKEVMEVLYKKHCEVIMAGHRKTIPRFYIYLDTNSFHEVLSDAAKNYPDHDYNRDFLRENGIKDIDGNKLLEVRTNIPHFNIVEIK